MTTNNIQRLGKHPQPMFPNTSKQDAEHLRKLVAFNREAGKRIPEWLPIRWDLMNDQQQFTALWFIRHHGGNTGRVAVARHIIGLEILKNEAAGLPPITLEKANSLWNLVMAD